MSSSRVLHQLLTADLIRRGDPPFPPRLAPEPVSLGRLEEGLASYIGEELRAVVMAEVERELCHIFKTFALKCPVSVVRLRRLLGQLKPPTPPLTDVESLEVLWASVVIIALFEIEYFTFFLEFKNKDNSQSSVLSQLEPSSTWAMDELRRASLESEEGDALEAPFSSNRSEPSGSFSAVTSSGPTWRRASGVGGLLLLLECRPETKHYSQQILLAELRRTSFVQPLPQESVPEAPILGAFVLEQVYERLKNFKPAVARFLKIAMQKTGGPGIELGTFAEVPSEEQVISPTVRQTEMMELYLNRKRILYAVHPAFKREEVPTSWRVFHDPVNSGPSIGGVTFDRSLEKGPLATISTSHGHFQGVWQTSPPSPLPDFESFLVSIPLGLSTRNLKVESAGPACSDRIKRDKYFNYELEWKLNGLASAGSASTLPPWDPRERESLFRLSHHISGEDRGRAGEIQKIIAAWKGRGGRERRESVRMCKRLNKHNYLNLSAHPKISLFGAAMPVVEPGGPVVTLWRFGDHSEPIGLFKSADMSSNGAVRSMDWSEGDDVLLAGSSTGRIWLWSAQEGRTKPLGKVNKAFYKTQQVEWHSFCGSLGMAVGRSLGVEGNSSLQEREDFIFWDFRSNEKVMSAKCPDDERTPADFLALSHIQGRENEVMLGDSAGRLLSLDIRAPQEPLFIHTSLQSNPIRSVFQTKWRGRNQAVVVHYDSSIVLWNIDHEGKCLEAGWSGEPADPEVREGWNVALPLKKHVTSAQKAISGAFAHYGAKVVNQACLLPGGHHLLTAGGDGDVYLHSLR